MAIQMFCGLPGSGKSYGVVENVVLPALRAQRQVWTNIPLNLEAIYQDIPEAGGLVRQFSNDEVNGQFLMGIPGGAVVIIDECWRFWPAGLKANNIPHEDKEFFAEHRHKTDEESGLTQEICLVTQSTAQVAKAIKELVDQTVVTRKNSAAGSDKTFNMDIYPGCAMTGQAITSGFGKYKPDVYKYYVSHTKAANKMPGIEIRADGRGRFYNHPFFKFVVPATVIAAVWGAFNLYHFFNPDVPEPVAQPAPVAASPVPVVRPVREVAPTPTPGPVDSVKWRLAGETADYAYIQDDKSKKLRRVSMTRCRYEDLDRVCLVDGERVSRYTGRKSQETNLGQTIVAAAPAETARDARAASESASVAPRASRQDTN